MGGRTQSSVPVPQASWELLAHLVARRQELPNPDPGHPLPRLVHPAWPLACKTWHKGSSLTVPLPLALEIPKAARAGEREPVTIPVAGSTEPLLQPRSPWDTAVPITRHCSPEPCGSTWGQPPTHARGPFPICHMKVPCVPPAAGGSVKI